MKKLLIVGMIAGTYFASEGDCNAQARAEFKGENILNRAEITRDKESKAATLVINIDGPWAIYSGLSADQIDTVNPILKGDKPGDYKLDVPSSVRSYFKLVTTKGEAILAERHLPMQGGYNFRDLGGFKTVDGRYVQWGKIIRSDDLFNLTDADMEYLSSLPLRTIVDFRSPSEIESAPDKLPSSVQLREELCITPGNLNGSSGMAMLSATSADSLMQEINLELVSKAEIVAQYKTYFQLLQDDAHAALLFHCSAGKDRTGMAAALTLFALGVDEATIMDDYVRSNVYLSDKYAALIAKYPTLKPLFEVNESYISAGLNWIKNNYGSVDRYLKEVLEVDVEKLRTLYLY